MRPMGIADILDETVELYKTSFVLLVGIAAVLYVPYSIFSQYMTMKFFPHINPQAINPADFGQMFIPLFGAVAIGGLWIVLVSPFVTGAMAYAISERYLSRRTTVVESFKRVLSLAVFGRLVLSAVADMAIMVVMFGVIAAAVGGCIFIGYRNTTWLFVAVPVGLLLCGGAIFGGVYVGLRLALVNCVIVVELKGAIDSFVRGWNLMKGSMLKYLALTLLASFVVGIVSSMAQQPTQSALSMSMIKGGRPSEIILIIHTLIAALTSTVTAPVLSIIVILLYYDIRIRKEGFDLELLASELHAKSQQAPAWAPRPLPQEQITTQLPREQAATEFELEQIPPEEGPTAQ